MTPSHTRWRILPVHLVAKLFGVLIKVEGIPFGSNRTQLANPPRPEDIAGGHVGYQFDIGLPNVPPPDRDRGALAVLLTQVIANSSSAFAKDPEATAKDAAAAFKAGLSAFEEGPQPAAPMPPQRPLGVDGLSH